MKNTLLALTSLVLLAAFAAPLQAQTLAQAAKREAERRAKLTEPVKVITNADLDALPARGGAAPAVPVRLDAVLAPQGAVAAEAAAEAAGPPEAAMLASDAESPVQATVREKRDEQHWRERATLLRDRLSRLQSDASALEGRVEGLRAAISAASGSQRAVLSDQLQRTEETLTHVQGELRLIQGEWRQFEDRATQAKIPLDWIR